MSVKFIRSFDSGLGDVNMYNYLQEGITMGFTWYRAVRFAYFGFFCSVNHLSGPLRKHIFTWTSSRGHVLWFVIGEFRSVSFISCFKVRCFVIVLFRAIIDYLSLLCRFLWSFSFLSLARIKQRLPPSFDKKSTHHRDFLCYSWAV